MLNVTEISPDKKYLELAKVGVYGSKAYVLMYSGSIQNVISRYMCDMLALTPEESNRRIKNATGVKSPVHGILKNVPIFFEQIVKPINFLVLGGSRGVRTRLL